MSHPAPQHRLADLRDWLMDQIDGSEETRGDDGLISDFIRQIDALPSEIAEPRGCPTPGACSAVADLAELADLKQRILPQFAGRAQRAEHERDALLEQLIIHRTAIANLHDVIDGIRGAAPSATAATDLEEFVRVARTFSDEHYQNSLVAELRRVYHAQEETAIGNARFEYLRKLNPREFAALYDEALHGRSDNFDDLVDLRRMKGEPDRPDWAQQLPGAEIFDRAARYEYIRTLNPRQFAALYNEALMGVHQFDDLVDRYRAKGKTVECGYDRIASLNSGRYVCTCGGACSHYDAGGRSDG